MNIYTYAWDCVLAVAASMLGHAGDVEEFEDKDGWLCIRTSLMRTRDIVHEPSGNGTPKEDRKEERAAARARTHAKA